MALALNNLFNKETRNLLRNNYTKKSISLQINCIILFFRVMGEWFLVAMVCIKLCPWLLLLPLTPRNLLGVSRMSKIIRKTKETERKKNLCQRSLGIPVGNKKQKMIFKPSQFLFFFYLSWHIHLCVVHSW